MIRVGFDPQIAPIPHAPQAAAKHLFPAVEFGGQVVVDVKIGLDDLARERPEAAATLIGILVPHVVIRPCPEGREAVESGELRTLVKLDDSVGLPGDDRPDQALLVGQVVVEL